MSLLEKIERRVARYAPSRRMTLPKGRGAISFCFDDFHVDAYEQGGRILEAADMTGTFYLCAGLIDAELEGHSIASADTVKTAFDAGHEIGCHTFSHMDCQANSAAAVATDLEKNKVAITELTGLAPYSFAYPFGKMSVAAKRLASDRFGSARGVTGGINRGLADLGNLRANQIYSNGFDLAALEGKIADVAANGGWLIFYTHEVAEKPSPFGCRPDEFRAVVDAVAKSGVRCLPVKHALASLVF
ncbi:polysaccharide deacetylase family protein [Gimibacter soli]|uniref:Chitooligosaccharide deacetylase n=1 Tax=Gimibacter soli TaxID=3024400 RepID=A0AAE9XTQ2_9PROT|nr:polysaccharide deacetylase family protein [Gimibacter soli]WCL53193.1 polysaccharide deacetylase family protein [Gimibacter soli]